MPCMLAARHLRAFWKVPFRFENLEATSKISSLSSSVICANSATECRTERSYYITCITLDLQDQPTSTVSAPTCSSRRHPFTSMTCGPAIGPIDHYVGNGATQPTAPPTVEHSGMHDVLPWGYGRDMWDSPVEASIPTKKPRSTPASPVRGGGVWETG
ncbi:hypothetical protein SFRURICE_006208 [Spodoptera frugiperda]|nr:hypothetical protein SFRURICE_006208 [Spodoptera frugiperda]